MFCPKCGKKLPDGAKFCSICGAELKIIEKNSGKENSSANKKNAEQTKIPSAEGTQKTSAEGSVDSAARNRSVQSEQPSMNSAQWYSDFREKVLEIVQYRWFKIAAVAVAVLIVVVVAAGVLFGGKGGLIASMNRFDPSKATETGTIQLNYGDTTHLDSIKSTLTFTEAEIENVDYDDLTLDIGWKFTLTPERKLNPDQEDLERSCETWLKKAEYSGNNGVSWFGLDEIDYNENCITYYVAATVGYAETVDKLTCQAGDDLSIELNYSIPINAEEILLTRGDNYMRDGNYAEALNTYQMISSPEAERKARAIECIDFAERVSLQFNLIYSQGSLMGIDYSGYYDPESYTYYQIITYSEFWEELGKFNESGKIGVNEATLENMASDIYSNFAAQGYSDITCVVTAQGSSGEVLAQKTLSGLDYINENGGIDQPTEGNGSDSNGTQVKPEIIIDESQLYTESTTQWPFSLTDEDVYTLCFKTAYEYARDLCNLPGASEEELETHGVHVCIEKESIWAEQNTTTELEVFCLALVKDADNYKERELYGHWTFTPDEAGQCTAKETTYEANEYWGTRIPEYTDKYGHIY